MLRSFGLGCAWGGSLCVLEFDLIVGGSWVASPDVSDCFGGMLVCCWVLLGLVVLIVIDWYIWFGFLLCVVCAGFGGFVALFALAFIVGLIVWLGLCLARWFDAVRFVVLFGLYCLLTLSLRVFVFDFGLPVIRVLFVLLVLVVFALFCVFF